MKRRAIKLILFLLAGATINVAVAWGCGLFLAWPARTENWTDLVAAQTWPQTVRFDWPSRPHVTSVRTNLVSLVRHIHVDYEGDQLATFNHEHYDFGWPLRSLGCELCWEEVSVGVPPKVSHHARADHGVWQPNFSTGGGFELIPLLPIWPGFAINTIFYAAIVWMMLAVPRSLSRKRRARRGLCVACGYSLRENSSEKCPECGNSAVYLTRSIVNIKKSPDV